GISAGLMALLFPWLLASSLRFRRRNTSLRGIRFNFSGSALQAYKALWYYYLMALILFGVLLIDRNLIADHLKINLETLNIAYIAIGAVLMISIPAIFMRDILQFSLCYTHYGKERFSAYLESSNFISFYWLAIFVAGLMYFFATALGLGLAYLVDLGTNNNTQSTTYGLDMMAGALILAMPYITQFISYYFVQASIFRESFRHLSLGNLRFMSSLLHIGYIGLMLKVTILTVFTLGFYYPWGRVALARYKVESVRVRGDIPLVFSAPLESASALGQEFTDGMNLDIGL
ncbi:MAG: YjgN family protein, partial [Cellvibrionaceae bacterium]|nr:YjgN family protein [Cellvibrionaceae bacterium]